MCCWLLQAVQQDPVLSAENFKYGTDVHRAKVRMWQGLSALAAFLGCSTQQVAATKAVKGELAMCPMQVSERPTIAAVAAATERYQLNSCISALNH